MFHYKNPYFKSYSNFKVTHLIDYEFDFVVDLAVALGVGSSGAHAAIGAIVDYKTPD